MWILSDVSLIVEVDEIVVFRRPEHGQRQSHQKQANDPPASTAIGGLGGRRVRTGPESFRGLSRDRPHLRAALRDLFAQRPAHFVEEGWRQGKPCLDSLSWATEAT